MNKKIRFLTVSSHFLIIFHLLLGGFVHAESEQAEQKLHVITKPFEPFVILQEEKFIGFSIELWETIADKMNAEYELYHVETMTELLNMIEYGEADIGIAGISMTAEREEKLDFSYPFFESGLQIMVLEKSNKPFSAVFDSFFVIFSPKLFYAIGLLLIALLIMAHIVWFIERNNNPDFSKKYGRGIWDGFWWAAVTITTVGYGDKVLRGDIGRVFGLFAMFIGFFIFASFTATVTTTLTIQHLQEAINGPEDLIGKQVATVEASTADQYLSKQFLRVSRFKHINKAYQALEQGQVDAVVYDTPALWYYASYEGKGKVKVVGRVFQKESYAIVFPSDSPLKEKINRILLKLSEDGFYKKLKQKWFGS
ncbi:transporter substrate-binding domain-containing protein [Candidatus Parabeggiatoa sp. HSG14]|uniref:transporter substrate-binding domain-containing protein n=1 Tax=Candidatus Parabeggiatoa sp. HSG14 TaxID=3055593 RepID=UPI0025A6A719|nr:transporter substrate-binding domain-containing protein [Thiotrichales bacterium HSG14]